MVRMVYASCPKPSVERYFAHSRQSLSDTPNPRDEMLQCSLHTRRAFRLCIRAGTGYPLGTAALFMKVPSLFPLIAALAALLCAGCEKITDADKTAAVEAVHANLAAMKSGNDCSTRNRRPPKSSVSKNVTPPTFAATTTAGGGIAATTGRAELIRFAHAPRLG